MLIDRLVSWIMDRLWKPCAECGAARLETCWTSCSTWDSGIRLQNSPRCPAKRGSICKHMPHCTNGVCRGR